MDGAPHWGAPHLPWEQSDAAMGQTFPQVPQLCGSLPLFTHESPQQVSSRPHVVLPQTTEDPPDPRAPPVPPGEDSPETVPPHRARATLAATSMQIRIVTPISAPPRERVIVVATTRPRTEPQR